MAASKKRLGRDIVGLPLYPLYPHHFIVPSFVSVSLFIVRNNRAKLLLTRGTSTTAVQSVIRA